MQTTASLRLSQVRRRLGITENQVRLLADRGDLPSYRTFGGQRRFREADVEAFAAQVRAGRELPEPDSTEADPS